MLNIIGQCVCSFMLKGMNGDLQEDFPDSVWCDCRVSYYDFSVDDGPREKQKSSGITICTGTGSSSWHFHINYLPAESVCDILKIGQWLFFSAFISTSIKC